MKPNRDKKIYDGAVSSELLRSLRGMTGALDFCFSY
jgi:hypothetical protein